jgi:hypothetical protein
MKLIRCDRCGFESEGSLVGTVVLSVKGGESTPVEKDLCSDCKSAVTKVMREVLPRLAS